MAKISIQELVPYLREKGNMRAEETAKFLQNMFEIIQEALFRDGLVKIKGLGTFKIVEVEPRESVNIHTGERVLIDGHKKISFLPDNLMKEQVNKPFSLFETVILNDGVDFSDTLSEVAEKIEEQEDTAEEEEAPIEFSLRDAESTDEHPIKSQEDDGSDLPIIDLVPEDETSLMPLSDMAEPEQVSDPKVEPTPEPIQEKEPSTMAKRMPDLKQEPVVEATPAPKLELEIEPEPEQKLEYEPEQEPELEPESSPVEEPTPEPEEEPMVRLVEQTEETGSNYLDDDEGNGKKTLLWGVLGLIAILLLGGLFYYLKGCQQTPAVVLPTAVVTDSIAMETADTIEVVADTITKPAAEPVTPETTPTKAEDVSVKAEESSVKDEEVPAKPELTPEEARQIIKDAAMYERLDGRLKDKGYYIAGYEREVYASEGDNLEKIARRTVGVTNTCYLSVYNSLNDTVPLKKGQKIYIPKLVAKEELGK